MESAELPACPKPPSEQELELLEKIDHKISDLKLEKKYLDPRNLVRFLRARNNDLGATEQMIRKNVDWIVRQDIANIFSWAPPPILDEKIPWKIIAIEENGCPLGLVRCGKWEPEDVKGLIPEMVRHFIKSIEHARSLCKDSEDPYPHQFSVIIDMEGLSWRHYLCYDAMMAAISDLKNFEANYPEHLRTCVFVNCPKIVTLFWNLVRPFLSPVTQTKLRHVLYTENIQELRDAMNKYLPKDMFPERYGGSIPNDFEIPPVL